LRVVLKIDNKVYNCQFYCYIYVFLLIFFVDCDKIILRRKIEYMHISEEVLGKSVSFVFDMLRRVDIQ
jgi:hypothetical protein